MYVESEAAHNLRDPTEKYDVSSHRLGHQEQSHITRGNVSRGECDNETNDTNEFRAKDVEELVPSLVRVSIWR